MNTVYIAIGSNLADRGNNFIRTLELINEHPAIELTRQSLLREYPAMTLDGKEQPDYLNGVVEVKTSLEPLELMDVLQSIEHKLGRPADHGKWQPRAIDLDILLYGNEIIEHQRLTIPHPEMHKRIFVLQPLCDIAPDLRHPVSQKTIYELLNVCSESF